jgi:phage-related protein
MNYFLFDGFRSDTAGLLVERKKTYGLPERDVEKIHVPGRSGDVLIDHGSYKNVRVSYDCAAQSLDALEFLRSALTAGGGYRLLTDSYSPWQRMALFASALDFDELILNRAYRFTVVFDCKPQRWADREQSISGSNSVALTNPGGCTTTPKVQITGTGNVTLICGSAGSLALTGLTATAVIDSEAKVAYLQRADGTCTNIAVPFFPELTGGTISATDNVTQIQVWPRWNKI